MQEDALGFKIRFTIHEIQSGNHRCMYVHALYNFLSNHITAQKNPPLSHTYSRNTHIRNQLLASKYDVTRSTRFSSNIIPTSYIKRYEKMQLSIFTTNLVDSISLVTVSAAPWVSLCTSRAARCVGRNYQVCSSPSIFTTVAICPIGKECQLSSTSTAHILTRT